MAENPVIQEFIGSGDSLRGKQWYQKDTYYQILLVEPASGTKERREVENITTSVLARTRGTVESDELKPKSFDKFELDRETIERLQAYPRRKEDPEDKLSSYLPSPGVVLARGFMDLLSNASNERIKQTELGNFYEPIRNILHSRKLSQLIAKTWWTYLEAKKKQKDGTILWEKFTAGEWDKIPSNILDGLIAREIFLFAGGDSPDKPTPEDPSIYTPLKAQEQTAKGARFLILPTSKAWQGIALSLLSSGQAYYKIGDKYHQVYPPVLSTGEIVFKYSFEVDWNIFQGQFKEITTSQESPWMVYQVKMPYPPIPSETQLDPNNIKKWAEAKEEDEHLPFYKKNQDGSYLIDVDYFRPPYPYIPLSSS
ncbi:MAG: hypothetical protein QNJ38_20100 [Prochloraceae cyanobacterium]|nr:hypothetical protein [Prochloraceae cyanobacterium]